MHPPPPPRLLFISSSIVCLVKWSNNNHLASIQLASFPLFHLLRPRMLLRFFFCVLLALNFEWMYSVFSTFFANVNTCSSIWLIASIYLLGFIIIITGITSLNITWTFARNRRWKTFSLFIIFLDLRRLLVISLECCLESSVKSLPMPTPLDEHIICQGKGLCGLLQESHEINKWPRSKICARIFDRGISQWWFRFSVKDMPWVSLAFGKEQD